MLFRSGLSLYKDSSHIPVCLMIGLYRFNSFPLQTPPLARFFASPRPHYVPASLLVFDAPVLSPSAPSLYKSRTLGEGAVVARSIGSVGDAAQFALEPGQFGSAASQKINCSYVTLTGRLDPVRHRDLYLVFR